jgi:hypothetical protein
MVEIYWLSSIPTVISMAQQHSLGIGSGGLPNWLWDPWIHLVGSLLHFLMDRVEPASGLLHSWIVMRGLARIRSIWRDMFSLLVPGSGMAVDLQTLVPQEHLYRFFFLIAGPVFTGILARGSRSGESSMCTLGIKSWPEWCNVNMMTPF